MTFGSASTAHIAYNRHNNARIRSRRGVVLMALLCTSVHAFTIQNPATSSRRVGTTMYSSRDREDTPLRDLSTHNMDDGDGRNSPSILESIQQEAAKYRRLPPIHIEDNSLLWFDLFLLVTVSTAASLGVVHRTDVAYLGSGFNEGCLMSICWLIAGLYNGAFLWGAVDGHYGSADPRGGPKAAGMLGFHTYIGAVNLRLLFALLVAIMQHRTVGSVGGELLIPPEMGAGVAIMSAWRYLHSLYTPRM